jgi:hypothetical protein
MPVQVIKPGRMPSNSLVAPIDTTIVNIVFNMSIKDLPKVGKYVAPPM